MNIEKVITGLEICVDLDTGCMGCSYKGYDMKNYLNRLQKDALEVIKSLVAENERISTINRRLETKNDSLEDLKTTLYSKIDELEIKLETSKTDVIIEFKDNLKERIGFNCDIVDVYVHIENLADEMLGV